MFVGHYAASLALKGVEKKASLGLLFLAVQFVDILFFPLVLLGIERLNIVENYTQSTHFELVFMPYTHGLVASILWAILVYALFRFLPLVKAANRNRVAMVMGMAVLSHWFLDLLVHTPDLPLFGDNSVKLGLGLWNNAIATYFLEAALLVGGLWVYLRTTRATTAIGKYGIVAFVGSLLIVNAANIFGTLGGKSMVSLTASALFSYFLFAGIAFWLDSKRA